MDHHLDFFINRSTFIKCKKGDINEFYKINEKELGKGAYGTVFKAQLRNSEKMRAIKQIKKKSIKFPETFKNEIQILKNLDHPNIIKIYETFEDQDHYYVVTDLCEGGQLFDRLSQQGNFSETHARQIFKQILYAVNYCHIQRIAHRDLKPENFLFMKKDSLSLKVIDFGLSYQWKKNMRVQLKRKNDRKLIGTSYYIAPEVLKGDYDERCDIWSLGVILYILVSAVPPFDGESDKQIIEAVRKGVYSFDIPEMKKVSPQLKDLISRMLMPDRVRITISDIYEHPWMKTEDVNTENLKLNYGRIMNFSKFSKLKTFAVSFIASQMPGKEIEKLGNLFKQIDLNHDGYLTTEELKVALQKQKQRVSFEQLQKLMDIIDTDHNGKINYSEFVASSLENSYIFKQENLINVFKMLDSDNNGKVSPAELKEALTQVNTGMNSDVIDDIIKECDKNHDGVIDFKEFLTSISQL